MKITNGKYSDVDMSYDLNKDSVGIVVRTRDDTKKNMLGLYIPRLMLGIDISKGAKKTSVSLKNDKLVNSVNKSIGESSVHTQNYVDIPCFLLPNLAMPRYEYNERVRVTMADDDIRTLMFYPFSVEDTKFRETDVIRNFVPAKKDRKEHIDDDNSYYNELNSLEQNVILISTSKKNGEKCRFKGILDTKEGTFTFMDDEDKGRRFIWDFEEDMQKFTTDGGLKFELKDTKATLECEDYEVKANNSISMETSKFKLKADSGEYDITDMKIETTNFSNEGQSMKTDYMNTENTGTMWNTRFSQALHTIPAFSVTGTVLAAGIAMGAVPGAFPAPPLSPGIKSAGASSDTDLKGFGMGRPLAYADATLSSLAILASVADLGLGTAMWHMHPSEYKPLCPDVSLCIPVVPKPLSTSMSSAKNGLSSLTPMLTAFQVRG